MSILENLKSFSSGQITNSNTFIKNIAQEAASNIFNKNQNITQEDTSSIFTSNLYNDNRTCEIKPCSAAGPYGDIGGSVIDTFDGESKDGKIGNTKQGATGDCWVLSGINAVNSTEAGKQLIKDSLEYTEDGTIVHFKGVGDYYVSNDEVTRTKGSFQYSSGDDDMIILELAIEKILDQIADDEIIFTDYMDTSFQPTSHIIEKTKLFNSSIGNGGFETFIMYALSGKAPKRSVNDEEKEEALNNFINNEKTYTDGENLNKDFALGAGLDEDTVVKDINGKKVKLPGPHAYSVKSADNNTVTIVNPHDSSKEIVLSKDVFLNTYNDIYSIDLSDNNPDTNFIIHTTKETVENSDGTKTEYIKDPATGNTLKEKEYYKNGKLQKETEYYQSGLFAASREYYKNGKTKNCEFKTYYENGSVKSAGYSYYDKSEKCTGSYYYSYNENGSQKSTDESTFEKGKIKTNVFKHYDEYGNYEGSTLTIYENGKAVKKETDTDGDGIYDKTEIMN